MPSVDKYESQGQHVEEGDFLVKKFSFEKLRVVNPYKMEAVPRVVEFFTGESQIPCVMIEKELGKGKGSEIIAIPRSADVFKKLIKASK